MNKLKVVSKVDKPGLGIISGNVYDVDLADNNIVDAMKIITPDGDRIVLFPDEYIVLNPEKKLSFWDRIKRYFRIY